MKEQEREKIKAMNLHGEELFEYCLCKTTDKDLSFITLQLYLDSGKKKDISKYLERIIYNNENVVYYYPSLYETDEALAEAKKKIKGKKCIGGIPDGRLYL
jgi:hypothetical protein